MLGLWTSMASFQCKKEVIGEITPVEFMWIEVFKRDI
jgi:hypothetical protein